ncbi:MAG: polyprenyl diphosphate synthase, partial [Clostridium sp.]|nr:polyprenyl diphosphate synthase [Clostridium sp.]
NALFSLLVEYFYKEIDELDQNNVRIFILGDLSRFQPKLRELMESAVERTKNNTGLEFAIALNYGSRAEILNAIKSIVSEGILPEELTEDSVSRRLYTGVMHCTDPDLIIRTAGEQRLSNFLLWQAAYSEFVFTDTAFPDFTPEVYIGCIKEFMQRTRRFGKVL